MPQRGGGPVPHTPLRQRSWNEPSRMQCGIRRDCVQGTRHPPDPLAGPPPGSLQSIRGPRACPASVRDNERSSRNRANAEPDVRQCNRWPPQSRYIDRPSELIQQVQLVRVRIQINLVVKVFNLELAYVV